MGPTKGSERRGCQCVHHSLWRKRTPHFKRPKSHFKKGELRLNAPRHVLKTPDVDNLAKFVLDSLQKNVLADDKYVTTLVVRKRWCSEETEERTEIELQVQA